MPHICKCVYIYIYIGDEKLTITDKQYSIVSCGTISNYEERINDFMF